MGQSTAEILFGFSSSPPPPPPRLSSLRDSGAGPALRETRSSDGGTSTGETRVRADGQFEWVVRAAPKGRGLKKRKLLLRALAEAWTVAAQEDGEERPVVRRMAIYRAMKGLWLRSRWLYRAQSAGEGGTGGRRRRRDTMRRGEGDTRSSNGRYRHGRAWDKCR